MKTGVYVQDARIIRIHPTLDRVEVPEFYVAAVVFHEMLHQAVPAREVNGRRIVHGAEFRRRERAVPGPRAGACVGGTQPLPPPLLTRLRRCRAARDAPRASAAERPGVAGAGAP